MSICIKNRFNNLQTSLVGTCGNFSYNPDRKAAIPPVTPPTKPTGGPVGSADCEINQRSAPTCCCSRCALGESPMADVTGIPQNLSRIIPKRPLWVSPGAPHFRWAHQWKSGRRYARSTSNDCVTGSVPLFWCEEDLAGAMCDQYGALSPKPVLIRSLTS